MRFKKSPQLPGAGRTRAWQHHGSHTPTSPGAILLSKMACQPKHFGRQCMYNVHTYARPYLCQSPVKSIQKLSIELMPQHCITLVPTVDKALDKSFS